MQITVISDAPLIVSGDNTNIINSVESSNTISVISTINNIYSIDNSNNIAVINSASTINANSPSEVVIAAGTQGPMGPAGGAIITATAPINLGGNRVVTSSIIYADSSNLGTVGKAIGITTGSATIGSIVNIQTLGELNGFFGLTPDEPVYLSTLGNITQILPLTGYVQKVGMAIDSTTLLINISEPIVL